MAWEVWLTFFGAAIAISVSPGAGAIQSMATGLTHGVRRGYWSILGLEVGLMLQLALVAVGLGAAVANSILAFNIIKWIGVAYLVFLAARQWRTATVDLREHIGKAMDGGRVALLVRGFLVNATNPKGLVFFLAVLPQFVVPTDPLLPQYLAVGVTMVAVDLVVMGLYTGLSVRLVKWLHTPRKQTILNRVFSGLFATAAVVLSLVRRGLPRCSSQRVKTVLPVIAGHAWGASSQPTTRSTAGARSQRAATKSRISGITARAFTRPVTNLSPRVYIDSSGISTAPW
jgi:homoserine/homoserine lactone efflux protein